MNHSHGYHGSDAGRCLFCGSGAPESQHCEEATKYEERKKEYHKRMMAIASAVKAKLTHVEQEAVQYAKSVTGRW